MIASNLVDVMITGVGIRKDSVCHPCWLHAGNINEGTDSSDPVRSQLMPVMPQGTGLMQIGLVSQGRLFEISRRSRQYEQDVKTIVRADRAF